MRILLGWALVAGGGVTGFFAGNLNGQWMLGILLIVVGGVILWNNRKGGPNDRGYGA